MPRYDLEEQTAIVTGAGRGIGRAIALRLAREGVKVTVADIDEANAAAVANEIKAAGGEALALKTDVTQQGDAGRMVQETVARFGRLDILVNNAGIIAIMPLLETDEATWDAIMAVNVKGPLFCAQAAARQMIEQGGGGRIINITSAAGKIAPGKDLPAGAYCASKHAAVGLTKQLGLELAPYGILVNAVCPGIVDTDMWAKIDRAVAERTNAPLGSVMARVVATLPVGRVQQPEDVANMVAFLASSDAGYETAQTFNVSGGRLPY
jgi:acetoin reductase-like protein